ncbi:sugar-binding protein [Neobacillus sp. YIM B02564]|uniref:Sugar-binding protein n=1 Tax=Neobacillus paridis TaxID=2803862 RepID=A0ABS1TP71_9BACI|nr:sugar-binding protein [Neobacillus paridis]MBL4952968.1 sugar-binding protein [Neobacillus paridis]
MNYLLKLFYLIGFLLFFATFSFAIYFAEKMNDFRVSAAKEKVPSYKYHFVLVPEEVDNNYWRLIEKGARDAANQFGIELEYVGPKQGNIDEHLKTLEMAAAAKVDGIISQGLTEKQFTPLINKLVKNGTPIITIDTDAENSNRNSYVGTNNYYAGFIAGQALLKDTSGIVNVAIITGSFHSINQKMRVNGFKAAVKGEERVRIIAIEESKISQIRAAEKTYQILEKYPQVNAIFGTSALDGIGIANSVTLLNRVEGMYIIGFDTLDETLAAMKKGIIDATVTQEPYEMGHRSVELMIKIIEGKKVPTTNYTNTAVIHKEDITADMKEDTVK